MFDLNREVAKWTAAVHASGCRPSASATELRDHLYCEIERSRADGLSDEEAFHAAVARAGSIADLTAEHAKNRSLLGTVCRLSARVDDPRLRREAGWLMIGNALVWATVLIVTAFLLKRHGSHGTAAWLAIWFYPVWWTSQELLLILWRHRTRHG